MSIDRGHGIATSSVLADSYDLDALITDTEVAKTAAQAAQAASELALDTFDDKYLGAKSADPTVDNDGDTLIDGAMFYDTTLNITKIYDLASTTWKRTTPTTTEQTKINTVSGIASDVSTVATNNSNVTAVADNTSNINTVAGINSNVTTVAGISANTTTVAGISGNVTTVAGISSDVTAVAADATDIGAVAGKATEIGLLGTADAISDLNTLGTADIVSDMNTLGTSGNVTNMNTLAGISSNITTAAGISSDITAVAADATDIGTVATDIADVSTVAGISSNVTTVANNDSNVTAVAGNASNINAVAGNATNINTVATNNTNITTVATDITNVNLAATNIADITEVADEVAKVIEVANDLQEATSEIDTVATNITNVNNVGNDITNVNTVATNLTSINAYGEQYKVAATAPSGPSEGDLWFDTTTDIMKVYSGTSWQNAGSSVNGVENSVEHTATASQTTFTATYDPGYLTVSLNGVQLAEDDYTATNGTSIVLDTGAALNDIVFIQSFGTFTLADHYDKTASDARYLAKAGGTMTGTIASFTSTGIDDNATSTAITIGSDENVGIGVTPETYSAGYTGLDIGASGGLMGYSSSGTWLSENVYYNSGWKYKNTDYSAMYEMYDGVHNFYVAPSDTADSAISWTSAMKIDNDGNVGVGTGSPANVLHVQKDVDDFVCKIENDGNSGTSDGLWIDTRWNGSGNTMLKVTTNSGGSEVMRVTRDGITFNGDTSSSNALDDFETGSFTPTTTFSADTISSSNCSYTKIGRMVHCSMYFHATINTVNVNIGGLPFSPTKASTWTVGMGGGKYLEHFGRLDANSTNLVGTLSGTTGNVELYISVTYQTT